MGNVDGQIIAAAQRGDQRAFASVAVACGDRLHAVASRILRDRALAEDATQDALIAIWRDLPQLRDSTRFDAWAYRVLVRSCLAERRRSPALSALPDVWDDDTHQHAYDDIADRDQLERAFQRLSVEQRAIVVLHHYLGVSLDEVARTLRIAPGTVRSRLFHAMRALRAAVDADSRTVALEALR